MKVKYIHFEPSMHDVSGKKTLENPQGVLIASVGTFQLERPLILLMVHSEHLPVYPSNAMQ